jgi:hypothetical protein
MPTARRGYRRKAELDRDLERYYADCESTTNVKGGAARRAGYCSGVAWKRARASGRYRDYPGFAHENPLSSTVVLAGITLRCSSNRVPPGSEGVD